MKTFLTCLSLTLVVMNAWACTISGVVSNNKQKPIPGATVMIIGTELGTVTDIEGHFFIKDLKNGRYTLEISSIGFTKLQQKVAVGSSASTITITLEENVSELEPVVVEGKSELRSEQPLQIKSININQFQSESVNVISVLDRSAGLRVRRTGGLGSDTNIQLNGFTGRSVRLYYDGIPMELLGGVSKSITCL